MAKFSLKHRRAACLRRRRGFSESDTSKYSDTSICVECNNLGNHPLRRTDRMCNGLKAQESNSALREVTVEGLRNASIRSLSAAWGASSYRKTPSQIHQVRLRSPPPSPQILSSTGRGRAVEGPTTGRRQGYHPKGVGHAFCGLQGPETVARRSPSRKMTARRPPW